MSAPATATGSAHAFAICLHRLGFEALAPLTPRREFRARREGRTVDRTGERRTQLVGEERRRIGDDVEDLLAKPRAVVSLRDEASG